MQTRDTLSADQWTALQRLFERALESEAEQRQDLFDRTSADDPVPGQVLTAMLAAHAQWRGRTEDARGDWQRHLRDSALLANGESIGPYRLLGVLGQVEQENHAASQQKSPPFPQSHPDTTQSLPQPLPQPAAPTSEEMKRDDIVQPKAELTPPSPEVEPARYPAEADSANPQDHQDAAVSSLAPQTPDAADPFAEMRRQRAEQERRRQLEAIQTAPAIGQKALALQLETPRAQAGPISPAARIPPAAPLSPTAPISQISPASPAYGSTFADQPAIDPRRVMNALDLSGTWTGSIESGS